MSPAARRLVVIRNPTAGRRRPELYQAVVARLRAAGCELDERTTARRGDAGTLAASLTAETCELLVVAGGDGTINEAVNGLVAAGSRLPLAIVPLGTANVLAAEIGLAPEAEAIAEAILAGPARAITLGRANGQCFFLMAGVGLDAWVVAGVDGAVKRHLGKGAYVLEALRQLPRFGRARYRLSLDGEAREATSAVIANARHYGGRFVVAPGADLETPDLEICLLRRGGLGAAFGYALAAARGRLSDHPDVEIASVRRVSVEGPPGEPVQLDGDAASALPLSVEALPAALNLVFPVTDVR
jgi:YegS/Rv2252/BmrU family lipid kinase